MLKELTEYTINFKGDQFYLVSGQTEPFLPVTTNSNYRTVETAQWKLLPDWIKTETKLKGHTDTYHIDYEGNFENADYKPYVTKYRGLLWVDGFYESRKGVEQSESYYVYLPEKRILSIGIVVAPLLNTETGETANTFSILTTKANDFLGELINERKRMPLIIPPDQRDAWLDANEEERIKDFFIPFNGLLQAHKVQRVTSNEPEQTNRIDNQEEIE